MVEGRELPSTLPMNSEVACWYCPQNGVSLTGAPALGFESMAKATAGELPSGVAETSADAAGCVEGAAGIGTLKHEAPVMLLLAGDTGGAAMRGDSQYFFPLPPLPPLTLCHLGSLL